MLYGCAGRVSGASFGIRPFNSSRGDWVDHFAKAHNPREEERKRQKVAAMHSLLYLVGVCDCS